MAKQDLFNESVTKVARVTREEVRSLQEEIRQTQQREGQPGRLEPPSTPSPSAPERQDLGNKS